MSADQFDLPTPNIPLLRKAVEWAEAEAARPVEECQWNQKFWATTDANCGTSYCIAGYTVMAAMPNAEVSVDQYGDLELWIDGESVGWSGAAQELLGITREERLDLFEASNTISDVRLYAEQIAARVGERL